MFFGTNYKHCISTSEALLENRHGLFLLYNGPLHSPQKHAAVQWFPYQNNTLPRLRALFKESAIPDTYPYAVTGKERSFYPDLNISNAELQFVIKISAHLNIDFWSTDLDLLKQVVKENMADCFVLKEYTGTAIG